LGAPGGAAQVVGNGEVSRYLFVQSYATGGDGGQSSTGASGLRGASNIALNGTAHASASDLIATAFGSSGIAQCTATYVGTHSTAVTLARAMASAPVAGGSTIARAFAYGANPSPFLLFAEGSGPFHAMAVVNREFPSAGTVSTILGFSNPVHDAINAGQGNGPLGDLLGTGTLAGLGADGADASTALTYSASVIEAVDLSKLTQGQQDLTIGLYSPTLTGAGFDALRFRIVKEAATVVDETFTDPTAAATYFDSHVLDLGPIDAGVSNDGILDLMMTLDVTAHPGDGFAAQFLVASATPAAGVPEPALLTVPLAALYASLLARRKRGRVEKGPIKDAMPAPRGYASSP
jgi:hypothetical protein